MEADTQEAPASVEDRLTAAVLGEEPQQEEPQQEEGPVNEVEEQAADEAEAPEQPAEDLVDIEYEGEAFKVPPKLKEAFLRQQDYTVKTQAVAEQRRAVEDRAQYLEAKETLLGAAYEDATEYRALQRQLEQFDSLNWAQLAQQDMQQAYTLDLQRQELRRQLQAKEQALQGKVAQIEQARKMHLEKQMELGRAEFQRRVGALKAEDAQATWKQAQSLGFTEQELANLHDARVMHAIYKAAKWDALQASKQTAMDKVSKAPPVVKPGANKASGLQTEKYKQQRTALRKSGRLEDAVPLLERLLND